ncbi:MAG: DinB family protein [Candidatus Eisenbacteria bacterium]
MMTKQQFTPFWGHVREVIGIGMRLADQLPADKLDTRPIPNMRTPKELLVHVFGYVKTIPVGITTGAVEDLDENAVLATIKTKDDLIRFCRECYRTADQAAATITDAQLASMVKTSWGEMPGFVLAGVVLDEFVHHRGQLYCMVRALGAKEVPMMWDFEHNAPEYRAMASASA